MPRSMPSLHHLRRRISIGFALVVIGVLGVGNVFAAQRIRRAVPTRAATAPVVHRAASAPVSLPVVRIERDVASRPVTAVADVAPASRRAAARSLTVERTELLQVQAAPHGPSADHPDALVYVPAGLDRNAPLSIVVFFHGWHGCAQVVSGSRADRCSPDGHRRVPLDLVRQFRSSRFRGILVVPQLGFDDTSTDVGTFRSDGAFRRFLDEVLMQMAPLVGAHRVADLSRVILASHSAGFMSLVQVLERGGVAVDEVALFDSMYRGRDRFVHWIVTNARRFRSPSRPAMRFVCVYQDNGIASEARQMARQLSKFFPAGERRASVLLREEPAPLEPAEARRPIVFARVPGDHATTARANFAAVLRGASM